MPFNNKDIKEKQVMNDSRENKSITKREQQIIIYLTQGLTANEIASLLFISYHTVVSHKKNLYEKLQVRNAFQFGVFAERMGLTSFE